MYHKRPLSLAVAAALGLSSLSLVPGQASAQDQQTGEEEGDALLEEVIVTGSRIVSEDGFGRTSPVTVVGMDAIASTGLTRVEDILNNLPSIETSFNALDANGATGTGTLDLRGLGTNRTLVLVNGRRMQGGGVWTEAPDINQIPASMIERVEVLTGGASATYGADAVAGVVNFIMRRVDGVEITAGWSGYQHDNDNSYIQGLMDKRNFEYPTGSSGIDGEAYNIDLVIGGDFAGGAGNATIYATWRKNQELRQGSRDYSSCALNAAGTGCGGSANAAVPNFDMYALDEDGNLIAASNQFVTLQPDSSLAEFTDNYYNYQPINHFQRPDERWTAGAFVDYEINEHFQVFSEMMFLSDTTRAQIAESGTFFAEAYVLPIDNALFPEAFRQSLIGYYPDEDQVAIYIGKRNVEGGPRTDVLAHDSYRAVAGLRGQITGNWDYEVSILHGETTSSSTYVNDFFAPSIRTAVDSEACASTPGCIPYEVFTYGGVTPEQAAGLTGTAVRENNTQLDVIEAFATGNLGFGLPAGDINIAGGYQYLKTQYESLSDIAYEQGLLLGQGGATPTVRGAYSVDSLFVEANVPLLDSVPFAENLTLDLAYRFSDYTLGFDTDTYRIGLDYQMIEQVRFRTGYNRAVRAPSVGELYTPTSLGLWTGIDPCAGANPEYTVEQCARTGVTPDLYGQVRVSPAGQYNHETAGTPTLLPEEADTWTFGIVWDAMSNMTVSVDYWDIEMADVIDNLYGEYIVRQCAEEGQLCERINRSSIGSLWLGTQGYVESHLENLAEQHWEGVDLAWNWGFDALGGSWDLNLIGTYMLTKQTTPIPAAPESAYDCVDIISPTCNNIGTPEWRHTASATYDSDSWWAITGRWRYYQDVQYEGTVDTLANDTIEDFNYLDLSAVFRFMGNHDARIGVNNVFDKEPPLVGSTLSGGLNNANSIRMYDVLGRYLFANVTLRY